MRNILIAVVALCLTSCARPNAEALRYAKRYEPACKRLEAEPQSMLENVAPSHDSPSDASTRESPEASSGVRSKQEIKAVIEASILRVRACYVAALRGWPDAEGDVVLRFEINSTGRVDVVSVVSNETDVSPLACCIADVARTWVFRAPAEPRAIVTYPFHLNQVP